MADDNNQKTVKVENKRGGFNLVLMGLIAIAVAITTTTLSMAIYHNSGDIYLDRSRPGFLPDEEEINDEEENENLEYDFSKIDKIDAETLKDYLDNINNEVEAIDSYEKPFSVDVLSDKALDIMLEGAGE